jgi:hypothetical protein
VTVPVTTRPFEAFILAAEDFVEQCREIVAGRHCRSGHVSSVLHVVLPRRPGCLPRSCDPTAAPAHAERGCPGECEVRGRGGKLTKQKSACRASVFRHNPAALFPSLSQALKPAGHGTIRDKHLRPQVYLRPLCVRLDMSAWLRRSRVR